MGISSIFDHDSVSCSEFLALRKSRQWVSTSTTHPHTQIPTHPPILPNLKSYLHKTRHFYRAGTLFASPFPYICRTITCNFQESPDGSGNPVTVFSQERSRGDLDGKARGG